LNESAHELGVLGVYGVVALIFWALMIVVSIEYAGS
jgi:K+ transporter